MHVYNIVHGGDCNKNCNFNFSKLSMHGYKFLNAILTEMKTSEKETYIFVICWGRRINVIRDEQISPFFSSVFLDCLSQAMRGKNKDQYANSAGRDTVRAEAWNLEGGMAQAEPRCPAPLAKHRRMYAGDSHRYEARVKSSNTGWTIVTSSSTHACRILAYRKRNTLKLETGSRERLTSPFSWLPQLMEIRAVP